MERVEHECGGALCFRRVSGVRDEINISKQDGVGVSREEGGIVGDDGYFLGRVGGEVRGDDVVGRVASAVLDKGRAKPATGADDGGGDGEVGRVDEDGCAALALLEIGGDKVPFTVKGLSKLGNF